MKVRPFAVVGFGSFESYFVGPLDEHLGSTSLPCTSTVGLWFFVVRAM